MAYTNSKVIKIIVAFVSSPPNHFGNHPMKNNPIPNKHAPYNIVFPTGLSVTHFEFEIGTTQLIVHLKPLNMDMDC